MSSTPYTWSAQSLSTLLSVAKTTHSLAWIFMSKLLGNSSNFCTYPWHVDNLLCSKIWVQGWKFLVSTCRQYEITSSIRKKKGPDGLRSAWFPRGRTANKIYTRKTIIMQCQCCVTFDNFNRILAAHVPHELGTRKCHTTWKLEEGITLFKKVIYES